MLGDRSTYEIDTRADASGWDGERDGTPEAADVRGWVSIKRMCRLIPGRRTDALITAAWNWLVAHTENGRVPEIAGHPVRMAQTTIRGRIWWCMHEDDAHRVAKSFAAFVRTFQPELDRKFGRYDPTLHSQWLSQGAAGRLIGLADPTTLLYSVWQFAQREVRVGRTPRIGEDAIRTRYFARDTGRTLFIHRDDVHLLCPSRFENGTFLTMRDVVDHFRNRDAWLGLLAERAFSELKMSFRRTGSFALRGIPLPAVRVTTTEGLVFRF